jgi:hypothetical protein
MIIPLSVAGRIGKPYRQQNDQNVKVEANTYIRYVFQIDTSNYKNCGLSFFFCLEVDGFFQKLVIVFLCFFYNATSFGTITIIWWRSSCKSIKAEKIV